jgi:hypothetical protein
VKREWKNSFVEKRNALNKKTYRFNFTVTDEDVSEQAERSAQRELKQAAKANAALIFGQAAQLEEKMESEAHFGHPPKDRNFDIESIQDATEDAAPQNFEDVQLEEEISSDGDDDGDEEGTNEEDEDDEQQTSVAEQMETTSSSSNADGADDESDLTQLDRAPSRKKSRATKREAEIDLEQDLGTAVAEPPGQASLKTVHKKAKTSHVQTTSRQKWGKQPKLEAYIGAEVYPNRMYPTGCPSFQKLSVKLFRVETENAGKGER